MSNSRASRAKSEQPHKVVADPELSTKKKAKILDTMEQDARLLDTATAEGMTGGKPSNLRQVLHAKRELKGQAASNPPPGSKAEVEKEIAIEKLDP